MKKQITFLCIILLALVGMSACGPRHLDTGHTTNYWKVRHRDQNTRHRYAYPDHDPEHPRYYH
ncbi:hypothetical protein ACTHGU_14790 [Chitinophagaceae bacterium MMS25-I14]